MDGFAINIISTFLKHRAELASTSKLDRSVGRLARIFNQNVSHITAMSIQQTDINLSLKFQMLFKYCQQSGQPRSYNKSFFLFIIGINQCSICLFTLNHIMMIGKGEEQFCFGDNIAVREKQVSPYQGIKKQAIVQANSLSTNQREGQQNKENEKQDAQQQNLLLGMNNYFPSGDSKYRQTKDPLNEQEMLRLAYFIAYALGIQIKNLKKKRFQISDDRIKQIVRIKQNLNKSSFQDYQINKKVFSKAHLNNYKVNKIYILDWKPQSFTLRKFIVFDQYKRVILNFGSTKQQQIQFSDVLQIIRDTFKSLINICYICITQQKKIQQNLISRLYACFSKKNPSHTKQNKKINKNQYQDQAYQSLTIIFSSNIPAINLLSTSNVYRIKANLKQAFLTQAKHFLKKQRQLSVAQNSQSIIFSTCELSESFLSHQYQKISSFQILYNSAVNLLKQTSPFSLFQFYKNPLLMTIFDAAINQMGVLPQKEYNNRSILNKLINRFLNQRYEYMQDLDKKQQKANYHIPQRMEGNCKQCLCCEAKKDKPRSKTKYQCQGCTATFGTNVRLCLSCFQDWHVSFQNKHKAKLKIPHNKRAEFIKHAKNKNSQRQLCDNKKIQLENQKDSDLNNFCAKTQQDDINAIINKYNNNSNFGKTKMIHKWRQVTLNLQPSQNAKMKQFRVNLAEEVQLIDQSEILLPQKHQKTEIKREAMDQQR